MRGNGGKQKNNKYGFVFLNIILKKKERIIFEQHHPTAHSCNRLNVWLMWFSVQVTSTTANNICLIK